MTQTWIASSGGPLILVPVGLRGDWLGIDAPPPERETDAAFRWNPDGPTTDYDRACDVADLAGVVAVGAGEALVLGDDPAATTWLSSASGGVLARWTYAPDEATAEAALVHLPEDLPWISIGVFRVTDSPLELFDAAEPGPSTTPGERIRIDLPPGAYEVDHTTFEPDGETSFSLIRLRRAALGPGLQEPPGP